MTSVDIFTRISLLNSQLASHAPPDPSSQDPDPTLAEPTAGPGFVAPASHTPDPALRSLAPKRRAASARKAQDDDDDDDGDDGLQKGRTTLNKAKRTKIEPAADSRPPTEPRTIPKTGTTKKKKKRLKSLQN
ncbi:hypothetical protein CDD82_1608 [Ophiocordyceps australis]|uniref:Uncharacterized protein n=1 Tax=Ophiocordyceps australis TaxID=1399860 RepID=A0A2C5Y674_9HYPO|nr:hypothetical protein CDD82_1608 [Ophiocordyceps australis]